VLAPRGRPDRELRVTHDAIFVQTAMSVWRSPANEREASRPKRMGAFGGNHLLWAVCWTVASDCVVLQMTAELVAAEEGCSHDEQLGSGGSGRLAER
jgi:hypothetical protein